MAEAQRARRLAFDLLAEGTVVGEAGEIVGHRLLGDELVQGDVLDRGRRLADQIEEHLALGGGERRVRRGRSSSPRPGRQLEPIRPSGLANA